MGDGENHTHHISCTDKAEEKKEETNQALDDCFGGNKTLYFGGIKKEEETLFPRLTFITPKKSNWGCRVGMTSLKLQSVAQGED